MKRLLLILFCAIFSANGAAPHKEMTRVNMNGVIIVPACAITSETQDQSIELGTVDIESITNGKAPKHPFSFQLVNCMSDEISEMKNTLAVVFMGWHDSSDSFFSLKGNTEGLAIQINDITGHLIKPGVANSGNALISHNESLHYIASLVKTANRVKAGSFNSTVNVVINYK
ncbi:TPA: fimbrial protein [Serratia fonticola]